PQYVSFTRWHNRIRHNRIRHNRIRRRDRKPVLPITKLEIHKYPKLETPNLKAFLKTCAARAPGYGCANLRKRKFGITSRAASPWTRPAPMPYRESPRAG